MALHRIAIIGCGGMAEVHADRFDQLEDRVEVTAAVDIVEERAKNLAKYFKGARWATDYRDVLDDCEAVLVVLPHDLHHEVGIECFTAGKHVLMEKPLANSESDCLDLIRRSNETGKVLMVAYCMRFDPLTLKLKELIDHRAYGDVFHISIWTEQHTQGKSDWWAHRADSLGGGQFFSHGCHYVDLLLWFLGRPVQGIHMGTNYGTPWMEKEGTSDATIRFESGAIGYHFGTWGAKGTRLGYAIHAHCTEGMIEVDLTGGKIYAHTKSGVETLLDTKKGLTKHTSLEMAHFLDCIETGKTPITNGPESLQGLRAIWRTYEAEQQGKLADLRGLGLDQVDKDGQLII